MERLTIRQTDSTLYVDFDPETATLVMRGESYPENAVNYFTPILEWLNAYFANQRENTKVTVDLDIVYFNSSSSKVLMNLFDIFDDAAKNGAEISILWRYHEENEIAQECGEEFGEELEAACFTMLAYGGSS